MDTISGLTIGNSLQIRRTVNDIPDPDTVVLAWFTVKESVAQPDSQAVLQKTITTSTPVGTGVIVNSSGSALLTFDILPTDWVRFIGNRPYVYDIKLKTSSGAIYTPFEGTISAAPQVTQATS